MRPRPRGYSTTPPVVMTLIGINLFTYLLQSRLPGRLELAFALWPPGEAMVYGTRVGFELWQLLTYGFLHGGPAHLFFNLFALWMFGIQIENIWGSRSFLFYFLVCVAGAAVTQLVVLSLQGGYYPTIGASGGVFGILLAFGMMFPNQRIMLLFPPIPMKAKYLVIGYGVLELTLGVSGAQSGVAHFAHLGGMLFGILLIQYWRGRFPFGQGRPGG
ncbi:MAG: rhomboid family intramembrane serine protease [Xanthomonadales bacterium]|nr:rhomboid family intramembrane serine protease [Xanthomonadales bacterium]